jgi:hypothetical protein
MLSKRKGGREGGREGERVMGIMLCYCIQIQLNVIGIAIIHVSKRKSPGEAYILYGGCLGWSTHHFPSPWS